MSGGSETMDEEGTFSVSDADESSTFSDDDGIVVDPPVINVDRRYDNGADCQPEQVVVEMNIIMEDVAAIVRLPPTVCRLLLYHYKWNKESLLEKFYESPDPDAFFADANIIMEEGRAYVACPELNCPIVVNDEKTLALIKSDTVKKRYRHLIINSFVEVVFKNCFALLVTLLFLYL
uniref:E3 ubiquitin-protein ligase ARIH1-like UBA-like domain-containing protein n=1 Tax=Parascaris equorum TaxID=6256 RepID=A0A914S1C9_PAREQ